MRFGTVLLILAVVVAGYGWCGGQSEDEAVAAIDEVWENYVKAVETSDAELFLDLHARDAYKMPPQAPMFQIWKGADNLKQGWAAKKQAVDSDMNIEPMETVILGDYAYSMGTYTLIEEPHNGDAPHEVDGKFLTVLIKNGDGEWEILRDCFNSNVPMTP